MKKKVVIERFPSSKKKVVIEGLPKADIGKRMAEKKANRMQSAWKKDITQYPNSIAYPNQQDSVERDAQGYPVSKRPDEFSMFDWKDTRSKPSGIDNTYYSGADPYVENPKYSDSKSVKNKKGLKNKKRANWDFSNFNVYLPGLNPKYNYLTNKLIGEIGNAKSIFKTGAPMKNQNYLGYNPYYSPFMYGAGGYLPEYGDAGITGFMEQYPRSNDEADLDKEPEFRVGDEGWYESMGRQKQYPIENVNPMGFDSQGNITERVQSINQPDLKKQKDKTKTLKRIKRMGAIGAPLSTLGTIGMEATGDALSFIGDERQSDQFNAMNAQIRAQAPMANVQPTTLPTSFQGDNPLATGAYGGRIKRYAADGMQIKQIGGMGEPNVEVEGEEHIQLPNGFSQEIKGKKHSEGGIPINLPSGTKIFSEKLKVPVKFIQELISVNPEYAFLKNISLPKSGNISYADLAKKFETKKYVDMLNSKDADPIQITTAQLMIQQNNAFLEKLFTLQEQNKLSGVHGPQVQQNAQQEQQEQEAQQAQMQGEQMEQPMMKYGGNVKKMGNGGWKDEWTKKILAHERKAGQPGGLPDTKGIYSDENWTGANASKFQKYIDAVKDEIPGFDSLPDNIKTRLVDYKFNTGRSVSDLLKLTLPEARSSEEKRKRYVDAINTIKLSTISEYLKNNEPSSGDYKNSKWILEQLKNPEFGKIIDHAKEDIYLTTKKGSKDFQENFDKNWFPRTRMWGDLDKLAFNTVSSFPNAPTFTGINPLVTAQPAAQPLALQPITTAENPRVKANYPAINYDQTTETGFKYGQPNQYDWLNWQRAIDESAANRWIDEKTGKRTGFKVPVPGVDTDIESAEKYYGTRDPQSLVNMAYQEQSYDDALDTPQGRKALGEMWEEVGNTNLGKKLGIKVDVKGLSKLNDKDLINVLNKLRPAYIDSQLDYRKTGYITPKAIEKIKKKEEQEADAMRGKTSFVPSEGSAATKGIPFNLGIGLPIPQIDSVYAGDYYKLQPQLEFLKRVTPDYNPATRAMRAMVTNDTDLSGVGMANRQNALANVINQMGDIQNQANLQNIGIEQQEKFGNRASIEQADRINLQGYQNYMGDYLKALGAKGTQEGLRKEAEKNYFSNAIKEANTINALQQAYFPGQYAQGTLGDVLETNPVVKYGGKVKKKVKIKPKLKNSYF